MSKYVNKFDAENEMIKAGVAAMKNSEISRADIICAMLDAFYKLPEYEVDDETFKKRANG